MSTAGIIRFDDGISAIDTEYSRPLADASHLIVSGSRAAFVDTGVNASVPLLLDALRQHDLDPGDVDYVFLTHVHLDHAGGAGMLMRSLPNARCVVHPRGAPHMISPAKLIAGTEAVYGVERAREQYGTIEPIPAERIDEASHEAWFELDGRALQTIYTEGHARHHYVINDPSAKAVFTGDSFGVSYRDFDTAAGEFIFPTATPIDFDPDAAHDAFERILDCEPEYVYLTHYSRVGGSPGRLRRLADDLHADIDAYRAIALDCEGARERQAAIETRLSEYLHARLAEHGVGSNGQDGGSIQSILDLDITLNAQGLSVWLDRSRKTR